MIDRPTIGVIVVNFNSGPYLARGVGALLRSDCPLKVVIVDNASMDDSLRAVSRLDPGNHELVTLSNAQNLGFSRAVNRGLGEIDTELVMLLNPDCEVHPHTIGRLAKTFDGHAEAGIVGALVFNENGTEQRGCRRREPTLWRSIVTSLGLGRRLPGVDMTHEPLPPVATAVDAVSGSAMMLRLDRLREIGGMEESYFLHCEDLDICHRMRNAGYQVLFEPGVSLFHRQGASGGASRQKVERLKHDGMLNYYRRHYHRGTGLTLRLMQGLIGLRYRLTLLLDRLPGPGGRSAAADTPPPADWEQPWMLLSGAGSDVGAAMVRRLHRTGTRCIALTRSTTANAGRSGLRVLSTEYFDKAPADDLPRFDKWIHLAPIWTWQKFEAVFARGRPRRIVALSSTSVVTKADSGDARERAVVEALYDGEKGIARFAIGNRASLAILRPTMIYGGPNNRNINLLKRIIRWLRVFPMVGEGAGLRQPVHASEVADACLSAMEHERVSGVYTIAGGEVLSYREMVTRVFESLGIRPRFISLSGQTARKLVGLVGRLPGMDMLSVEMLDRLERDQAFSNENAIRDFGFGPGPFKP